MRQPTRTLPTCLLALTLLGSACGDDRADVDAVGGTTTTHLTDGDGREVPERDPDLVGTITAVAAFEPVTEDCVPGEDLEPDDAVSSEDLPVCTPSDSRAIGTVLVEEDPGDPGGGQKVSYAVTVDTGITGETAEGSEAVAFADLREGQLVEAWTAGPCAESYPEQCGAEAIRVTG